MKYLVLRTCFREACYYRAGDVREVPDSVVQKHPKDFQLAERPDVEADVESNPLVCPECGKECKSQFGLQSHLRIHKT